MSFGGSFCVGVALQLLGLRCGLRFTLGLPFGLGRGCRLASPAGKPIPACAPPAAIAGTSKWRPRPCPLMCTSSMWTAPPTAWPPSRPHLLPRVRRARGGVLRRAARGGWRLRMLLPGLGLQVPCCAAQLPGAPLRPARRACMHGHLSPRPSHPPHLPSPRPDLRVKNWLRFPAVNGSALDAARLVTPQALQDITAGKRSGPRRAAGSLRATAHPGALLRRAHRGRCHVPLGHPLLTAPPGLPPLGYLPSALLAARQNGYRTKHYQLTHGSLGCYLSHLQLYQHILRSGEGSRRGPLLQGHRAGAAARARCAPALRHRAALVNSCMGSRVCPQARGTHLRTHWRFLKRLPDQTVCVFPAHPQARSTRLCLRTTP